LTARALLALIVANLRYWTRVAPLVAAELARWRERADQIPDPTLRSLALAKLSEEDFNSQVAATLATLAPPARRGPVVEAIVALEVMYDYLDGLTEARVADPLRSGERLFQSLTDALLIDPPAPTDYYQFHPSTGDGGYLVALSSAVSRAVVKLPACQAVAPVAQRAAVRCAQAQVRVHAVPDRGIDQLRSWSEREAAGTGLEWREFVAGAVASVLAAHVLIAAAADARTTRGQAVAIDRAYLCVSAVSTMLDSLIDYEHDLSAGDPWHVALYEDGAELADRLRTTVAQALDRTRVLPHRSHHVMTLFGVIAYYVSSAAARSGVARPMIIALKRELGPLILPTLAVMRTWRAAKRLKALPVWAALATARPPR
jgi:tetraprenyl-beta-curcumene synthase